jgi:UDP-N-acetylmuramate dehydrogenase
MPLPIKKNVILAPYTTFKIGGPAKYFFVLKNVNDLPLVLNWAEKKKLPVFIMAGGSNLLISDKGYSGLVILMKLNQIKMEKNRLLVSPGLPLANVLNFCLKNKLSGLEWAAGIPGTIGGAVVDNAGAFGQSIGDLVEKVRVFNLNGFKIIRKKDLKFSYRQSRFKKPNNKYIITQIWLKGFGKLTPEDKKLIITRLQKRKDNQPQLPSAGCVFKNFIPHRSANQRSGAGFTSQTALNSCENFQSKIKVAKHGFDARFTPIPAGKLIQECGLKGKRINDAEISEKHANFIVNRGQARAQDVLGLITLIKREVKKKFKINLQEEVLCVGFDKENKKG